MNQKRAGFTLVETTIAVAVFALLITGGMAFFIQSTKGIYVAAQRLELGSNIRKFNDEMVFNASRANEAVLYLSKMDTDRDTASDRLTILTTPTILHPSGNLVVFVYYNFPKEIADAFHRIRLVRGYYVDADATSGIGPVKKFEIDFSASPSDLPLETILTTKWATAKSYTFLFNVRGLAINECIAAPDPRAGPRLFYKNEKRAITVSGQIYQSKNNSLTNDWKTSTESFNFIVTPRS